MNAFNRLLVLLSLFFASVSFGVDASSLLDKPAPTFELKNQDGKSIKLADRKGQGWTVLFFYPKAGTPGCTTQACAFRDSINVIKKLNAQVFGISADTVAAQKKFHEEHKLAFDLLADAKMAAINLYQVRMANADMSKRVTFILDDQLVVRKVFTDVDPAVDAKLVAQAIEGMQSKKVK